MPESKTQALTTKALLQMVGNKKNHISVGGESQGRCSVSEQISEVFAEVVKLALALGKRDMGSEPGCWEHQLDERWWFALNPHAVISRCSKDADVPGFSIYIQFNGWPAGIIGVSDGVIAVGSMANEETFIEALKKARTDSGLVNSVRAVEGDDAA